MGHILGDESFSFDLKEVCYFLQSEEILPVMRVHLTNQQIYKANEDTAFFFSCNLKAHQSHGQGMD